MANFQLPYGIIFHDFWNLIFDKYVTDPYDWRSLSTASPEYFEPLVHHGPRKWAKFLPEVVEILDRKDYLSKSEILKCRLISKFWKDSIDSCIRVGNPCFEELGGMDHDTSIPRHDKQHCWNRTLELEMFGQIPLYFGKVIFQLEHERIWGRQHGFVQRFKHGLEAFGSQVTHFEFTGPRLDSEANNYRLLCEFLELMPNLRTLYLITLDDLYPNTSGCEDMIRSHSLPNLKHLVVLKILKVNPLIANAVLSKYASQLEQFFLQCTSAYPYDEDPLLYDLNLLTHLKSFVLPIMYSGWNASRVINQTIQWKTSLKSLTIPISQGKDPGNTFKELCCDLHRYFFVLEKLECVNFIFTSISLIENISFSWTQERSSRYIFICPEVRLSLPKIKRLWIRSDLGLFTSIDFILGLADTLEELTLILTECDPEMYYEYNGASTYLGTIQFFQYCERMHLSNIWELMPKLQQITIRWRNPDYRTRDQVPLVSRYYQRRP